jgi:hypothetical protein
MARTTAPKSNRARAIARTANRKAVMAGNSRALRSGIYSRVAVREDVLDEAAWIFARAPWLTEVRDGPLVEATARLAVRLRRLDDLLTDPDRMTQTTTSLYARLEGQLTRNLSELGLTPRASADLGLAHMDAKERVERMTQQRLAKYRVPAKPSSDEASDD